MTEVSGSFADCIVKSEVSPAESNSSLTSISKFVCTFNVTFKR